MIRNKKISQLLMKSKTTYNEEIDFDFIAVNAENRLDHTTGMIFDLC